MWKTAPPQKPLNPYKKESISIFDIIRTPEKVIDARDEESLEAHQEPVQGQLGTKAVIELTLYL